MAASITQLGKLVLGTGSGFSNPFRLDFIDLDNGITQEFKDMNGTRGKYTKDDIRVRNNRNVVNPRLRCQPSSVELSHILSWILGGTPAGTSYPLGNAAVPLYVWYLPNNGTEWQIASAAVDTATFRCSSGEPLDVELELVGTTFTNPSMGFPATALDVTTAPFIFSDCVLDVASSATLIKDMTLTIRNNIDRSRFLNSLNLTATYKLHREIVWEFQEPAGDYDTNWNTALTAGAAMLATFTQPSPATAVLTLTSGAVRLVPKSPAIPFQAESFLTLQGEAYSADGTTEALLTTLTT